MDETAKKDVTATWPASVREAHAKAVAAAVQKAADGGWSERALERMRNALADEYAGRARAAQARNRAAKVAAEEAKAKKQSERKADTHLKCVYAGAAYAVARGRAREATYRDPVFIAGLLADVLDQLEAKDDEAFADIVTASRATGERYVGGEK